MTGRLPLGVAGLQQRRGAHASISNRGHRRRGRCGRLDDLRVCRHVGTLDAGGGCFFLVTYSIVKAQSAAAACLRRRSRSRRRVKYHVRPVGLPKRNNGLSCHSALRRDGLPMSRMFRNSSGRPLRRRRLPAGAESCGFKFRCVTVLTTPGAGSGPV